MNQPPIPSREAYQIKIEALGRLSTPEEFADIIVKSDNRGHVTRVRDIGRVEVGAADYGSTAYKDRGNATVLLIYAEPGANSLAVDHEVLGSLNELKKYFPPGVADPDDLARVHLGVATLAVATGAGAEMRQSLGTAVLFGMLGVTCFGLIFTPAFYTFIGGFGRKGHKRGVLNLGAHSTSREDREPVVSA